MQTLVPGASESGSILWSGRISTALQVVFPSVSLSRNTLQKQAALFEATA